MTAPFPENVFRPAMDAALRLLSFRARGRAEMTERLLKKGHPADLVDAVVNRLVELRLVNDGELTRSLVQARWGARQGEHRIRRDLRKRGLAVETINAALREAAAQTDSAPGGADRVYDALAQRARRLVGLEPKVARRRLEGFLFRQGFDPDDVRSALRRYFKELSGENE